MRALLAITIVVPAIAHAQPWRAESDFDGSEPATQLVVDASGSLQITSKAGSASVPLGTAITHATLQAAVVQGAPTVVVDAVTPGGEEAIVVERRGASWSQLVRTPVGGVGLDRDYGIAVRAEAEGIYRFQTRPGFHRCDGKPAMLFAEGYNRAAKRFQPLSRVPANVPEGAPVIAARAEHGDAAPPVVFQARIASHDGAASDAGGLGVPKELDDGAPATMWTEQFQRSDGEGQFFTYEPRVAGAKAVQLRVVPGARDISGRHFNRVKRVAVVWASGAVHVDVPEGAGEAAGAAYVADLPAPVEGCVSVVLEATYGPPAGTTAIGELEVFAEGERQGGGDAMLAAAIAAGSDAQSAGQELARRGAAGVAAVEAELAKTNDAGARHRLVRALLAMRDPAAGPLLARAMAQGWIGEADRTDAIRALGTFGETGELRELAGKNDLPIEARVAAVHALAGKPELALELAGQGPRALRHAVIEVATSVAMAELVRAAQAASAPAAAGDLWRAVTRRAHATAAERPVALTAMTAALPGATDYERRYRLIDGIAAIGDAPALAALANTLRGIPAGHELAAFEQVAARAIAVNPRPEAFELITGFARDADPGVRLAALDALAGSEGGPAGPWHPPDGADSIDRVMITALSTDRWPDVRRRAAQLLGGRCARIGPAKALGDAAARDADVVVRGDALAALVECKAQGTAELLARLWDDGKAPIELRLRAVDLAVGLGDRALAGKLVAKYASWRGAAIESEAALALVQNAAYAIGRLAPPGAAAALEAGLDDAGFPEIMAASATGLGLMGKACPADAKAKLQALARSDDAQVAVAARRAEAVCGK